MDQTKVVIVLIAAVVALISLLAGYVFISSHWEDIKSLFIIALVLGGTVSVAIGGLKIRSKR